MLQKAFVSSERIAQARVSQGLLSVRVCGVVPKQGRPTRDKGRSLQGQKGLSMFPVGEWGCSHLPNDAKFLWGGFIN
ncbi:hypothetical protein J6590_039247 [Homalodisca vitripennis]|nr:hypothetical protein J6590_039247 [Homalodisca vitripennis]